jgi:hypothetical protein
MGFGEVILLLHETVHPVTVFRRRSATRTDAHRVGFLRAETYDSRK